ncbi:heat-inducible transcriptional repressor HrcA [Ureaplasma ceti]|uniref:Heat-inducible transcription repressor HrcA n=1 Tax=Ureaplasma ceti TaxID=3119530 RepID=A0ABP9U918_9BACT
MKLTERQFNILKIIVDEYTANGEPISSKLVAQNYNLKVSAQTIRNEMGFLEKNGLIEKTHISSGRIPSKLGLEYYNKNMALPQIDALIEGRLKSIFIKREESIDQVFSDALTMLSDITKLPSVSSTYNLSENLREVSMVQLDDTNAILMVVTSFANVYKTFIQIKNQSQFNDVKTCIKLFNKHLVGTKLINLDEKLAEVQPIIRERVKEYDYITKEIIRKLFDTTIKCATQPKVIGMANLFNYEEFKDSDFLQKILTMLENGNIWKQLESDFERADENELNKVESDNNVRIEFKSPDENNHNTILVASTSIRLANNVQREISVLGPTRVELSQIKGILNFLKEEIEKIVDEQNGLKHETR